MAYCSVSNMLLNQWYIHITIQFREEKKNCFFAVLKGIEFIQCDLIIKRTTYKAKVLFNSMGVCWWSLERFMIKKLAILIMTNKQLHCTCWLFWAIHLWVLDLSPVKCTCYISFLNCIPIPLSFASLSKLNSCTQL